MAHNLATQADGRAALAFVGDVPWHGLGTKVEGIAMTAAEAMAAAGLDWEVEPVDTMTVDGAPLTRRAIRRCDNGVVLAEGVSKRWTPVQNYQLFEFFDPVVGAGQAIYHTVGALGQGERLWVLARLPGEVVVGRKDVHEKYLLLANSHKPGFALHVGWTAVRVVCQNTLHRALAGEDIMRFIHTANVIERAEAAKVELGVVNKRYDELGDLFNALAARPITAAELGGFFGAVFPLPGGKSDGADARRREALSDRATAEMLFSQGRGADLFPGTAYQALQAVTELTTHDVGRKKPEGHLADLLFGQAFTAQGRALVAAEALLR